MNTYYIEYNYLGEINRVQIASHSADHALRLFLNDFILDDEIHVYSVTEAYENGVLIDTLESEVDAELEELNFDDLRIG